LPVIRAKGRDATQCRGGSDLPRKVGGSRCGEKVGFVGSLASNCRSSA
jgi:hypothetical protein